MRDPLYIDPSTEWKIEIPQEQRLQYEKVKQSETALQKSLNEAHDRIRRLTNTNNNQAIRLQQSNRRLDLAGLKLWILGGLVTAETGLLLWVVKVVLTAHLK